MIANKPPFETLSISQPIHCVRSINSDDINQFDSDSTNRFDNDAAPTFNFNNFDKNQVQRQIEQAQNIKNKLNQINNQHDTLTSGISTCPSGKSILDIQNIQSNEPILNSKSDNEIPCNLKDKLLYAIRNLIPYKSSLTLRLLVSYAVDNGVSEVIVIDETIHRDSIQNQNDHLNTRMRERSPLRPPQKNNSTTVLDLSCREQENGASTDPLSSLSTPTTNQFASMEPLSQTEIAHLAKNLLNVQFDKPTRFAIDQSVLNIFPLIQEITTRSNNCPISSMVLPQIQQPTTTPTSINQETLRMLQSLITSSSGFETPIAPFNFCDNPFVNVSQPTILTLPNFNSSQEFTFNMPISQSIIKPSTIENMIKSNFQSSKLLNNEMQNISTKSCSNFLNSCFNQSINGEEGNSLLLTNNTFPMTNNEFNESLNEKSNSVRSFSRRFMHPRRFMCNQCRQDFPSLAELNRHTLDLHNSFRCNFCRAKFTQRSNLQRHSLKHVGFKPFTCNICKKEYYRKDHLVRHIEVTHPTADPKANITVRLTSSECLDFLDNLEAYPDNQVLLASNELMKRDHTEETGKEDTEDAYGNKQSSSNEEDVPSPKFLGKPEQAIFPLSTPSTSIEEISHINSQMHVVPELLNHSTREENICSPIIQTIDSVHTQNSFNENGALLHSESSIPSPEFHPTLEPNDDMDIPEMRPLLVDEEMDERLPTIMQFAK